MQWQAKQQEEAQNYQPSDVPKLAQNEYYNMGDSDNKGNYVWLDGNDVGLATIIFDDIMATDMQNNQEQEMERKADGSK